MSLDKAIEHGKEHREPYRGSKAFDKECRNHGGCPACESNRMHSKNKRVEALAQKEREFEFSDIAYIRDNYPEVFSWLQEKAKWEHETLWKVALDNADYICQTIKEENNENNQLKR